MVYSTIKRAGCTQYLNMMVYSKPKHVQCTRYLNMCGILTFKHGWCTKQNVLKALGNPEDCSSADTSYYGKTTTYVCLAA